MNWIHLKSDFFMTKTNWGSKWMMYKAGSLPKNNDGVNDCPIILNIALKHSLGFYLIKVIEG